jgi:fructokinase
MMRAVDVAGTGFTVLDRVYSAYEPTVQALGGSCGNVLVSLAMLARSVAPVLSLGEDTVGNELVTEFAQAGALTRYIFQRPDRASPVLAQRLDATSGQHTFSFICPETEEAYPRYWPIGLDEVHKAAPALSTCHIFYTDRISEGIVEAMATAAASGAIIYFEPSAVDDPVLFSRAVRLADIVKYSRDRLDDLWIDAPLREGTIAIVTRGAEGLEVSQGGRTVRCPAKPAACVRDTCGSGDMVTIGLIDWILAREDRAEVPHLEDLLEGVIAGQRLAAANCAFSGARGLFKHHGAQVARRLLDDPGFALDLQFELFAWSDYSAANRAG